MIVGKSALVIQFVENRFEENYHATIETTYEKTIGMKRSEFDCFIIDTAGQVCYSINLSISSPLFYLILHVSLREMHLDS